MRELFGQLYGNDALKARLGSAIAEGRLPHAILIDGPRGSGKLTLALNLAAALNCENRKSTVHPLPCGACNTCRKILTRSFTDVKLLEMKSGKATIGVDEVAELKEDMYLSATESEYKVYIIRNAERLTAEAQNSLLIVLEEPPRGVVIMLLTESPDKILTTIKSRAQYVPMSRFSPEEIERYLEDSSPEYRSFKREFPSEAKKLPVLSDGRIGRAKELMNPKSSEEAEDKYSTVFNFVRALKPRTPFAELYSSVGGFSNKRAELQEELELLMNALRDLCVSKVSESFSPLFFPSVGDALEAAEGIPESRIIKIFDAVRDAHEANFKNANITVTLNLLAVKIKNI